MAMNYIIRTYTPREIDRINVIPRNHKYMTVVFLAIRRKFDLGMAKGGSYESRGHL